MDDYLVKLRALMPYLRSQYKIETLAIFGSFVRHEQNLQSDLDLLITFTEVPGLFGYIELENFLSDQLGIKVDLVMRDALKPNIAVRILSEAVDV